LRLQKGDEATRTRDPGRGSAVVGGLVGGIDGGVGHTSVAMVEGAVVELAVPAVFVDVLGVGTFEGSELFGRKVFREAFDWKAGKIVGHLMCFWRIDCVPFNPFTSIADCSFSMDW